MSDPLPGLAATELDRTIYPAFCEQIAQAEQEGLCFNPRTYPGYPRWPLPRLRPRLWSSLDRVLRDRRCRRRLRNTSPSRNILSRLLQFAHGVTSVQHGGPAPSAGGLNGVELYLVHWGTGWLPVGLYHYDRGGHHLSQLTAGANREDWVGHVPSLPHVEGGALLWVLIGDLARVRTKYSVRAERFLLLEAGHVMQNLCLLSASLGLATVPMGGCFEREIAHAFRLPPTDRVLYVGICGLVG